MSDPTFVGPAPRDMPQEFPVVAPSPPVAPPPPTSAAWVRVDAQGEIASWGYGLVADVPSDALLGAGSPATHYVVGQQLVAYTPEQAAAKVQRPSFRHEWSNAKMSWNDPRSAADIAADKAAAARTQRDALLAASDWTQLSDAPALNRGLWTAYRAQLRLVPQQAGFPTSITWPVSP